MDPGEAPYQREEPGGEGGKRGKEIRAKPLPRGGRLVSPSAAVGTVRRCNNEKWGRWEEGKRAHKNRKVANGRRQDETDLKKYLQEGEELSR